MKLLSAILALLIFPACAWGLYVDYQSQMTFLAEMAAPTAFEMQHKAAHAPVPVAKPIHHNR